MAVWESLLALGEVEKYWAILLGLEAVFGIVIVFSLIRVGGDGEVLANGFVKRRGIVLAERPEAG